MIVKQVIENIGYGEVWWYEYINKIVSLWQLSIYIPYIRQRELFKKVKGDDVRYNKWSIMWDIHSVNSNTDLSILKDMMSENVIFLYDFTTRVKTPM